MTSQSDPAVREVPEMRPAVDLSNIGRHIKYWNLNRRDVDDDDGDYDVHHYHLTRYITNQFFRSGNTKCRWMFSNF